MLNLRFSKRFLKRALLYVMVAFGMYVVHLHISTERSVNNKETSEKFRLVGKKESKFPKAPNEHHEKAKQSNAEYEPPSKEREDRHLSFNDMIFDEKDMVDEHGNPYSIGIWVNAKGKPGYLANPQECLGNVSCDIFYTTDPSAKTHAIVFKSDYLNSGFPMKRYPNQLYAWWTGESPLHTSLPQSNFDDAFNLTFHYRTDADVYAPYGSINLILRELNKVGETGLEALLEKKRKSDKVAAWAVSNCYGKRLQYAKSLMDAGLKVDTFGSCFGHRQLGTGRYSDAMYQQLSEYKFYFSFENSINCKDYFTEKFWFNGLRSGAVPIVWGPSKLDLLKVAPTKSFIHANDFSTPEALVTYLNYLASNETAYAEYLQWRTWVNHPERIETRLRMENRDNDMRSYCKLCSILQADGRRRKLGIPNAPRIVPSIRRAWKDADANCYS